MKITPIVAGFITATLTLPGQAAVDFGKEVLPILQSRCLECHGPEKQKAKLRLDSKEALLKGGSDGEVVKPGDAAASELYKRVSLPADDDDRMPSKGDPLTAEQITVLKNWINEGAAWPDGIVIKPAGTETASTAPEGIDFARDVAPILSSRCIECHGPDKQKAKLRLDSHANLLKGGEDGEVVKVSDAAASELFRRVSLPSDDDDRMPPKGDPLTKEQLATLKEWINHGAAWPEGLTLEAGKSVPGTAGTATTAAAGPTVPPPVLPKDFAAPPGESNAIAALAKGGIDVRPIAQNVPWHEVNLRLLGDGVTDKTLAPLKEVPSLIEVRLGTTKVTDEGLGVLKSLPYLQVLGLELTGITDAGVAELEGLTNLTYLNLYGTGISDAALAHLEGMKHLRNLYLWQTKVTAEGTGKLQAALPGLNINTGIVFTATASTNAAPEKKEASAK